jgi:RNA polymerase subunit RPABC4/transcription elongation factor Spt4
MVNLQPAGNCPRCHSDQLTCKYNHFQQDELEIHSWEHRCPDCGNRQTSAFRNDDEDELPPENPAQCPYCGRSGQLNDESAGEPGESLS